MEKDSILKGAARRLLGGALAFALALNIFAVTGLEANAADTITNADIATEGQCLKNGTEITGVTHVYYYATKAKVDEAYSSGSGSSTYLCYQTIGNSFIVGACDTLSSEWKGKDWHVHLSASQLESNSKLKITVLCLYPCDCPPESTPTTPTTPTVRPHSHSYKWVTTLEPTKTQDGLEEYRCECGAVEASQPISMYMFRIKELYGLIKDAPKGGSVTYDFDDLSVISDYILAKLAERNDVAVTVSFTYGGEAHSITFPAGTDYTAVLNDEDAMYGFYGVAAKLGLAVE